MITITRRIEFDAGHRIPNHNSACRNLHGHRYALEITLSGQIIHDENASNDGMVMDFSDIKNLVKKHLIDEWDHAFLVYRQDHVIHDFLQQLPDHKTVVLDCVPTVENLVLIAFKKLSALFDGHYGKALRLSHLKLYETPSCWAEAS